MTYIFSALDGVLFFFIFCAVLRTDRLRMNYPAAAAGALLCAAFSCALPYLPLQVVSGVKQGHGAVISALILAGAAFALVFILYTAIYLTVIQLSRVKDRNLCFIGTKKGGLFPVVSFDFAVLAVLVILVSLKTVDCAMPDYKEWNEVNVHTVELCCERTTPTTAALKGDLISRGDDAVKYYDMSRIEDLGYPIIRTSDASPSESSCHIVVVGDSFVWGENMLNINNVFWRRLDSELLRRGYDCDITGVGIAGASTADEYSWIADSTLIEDLDPDIIIIGYVPNDPDLDHADPFTGEGGGSLYNFARSLEGLYPLCPNIALTIDRNLTYGYYYNNWEHTLVSDDNLAQYKQQVTDPLAAVSQRTGVPIVVTALPTTPDHGYYDDFYEPAARTFEASGIKFYNCLDEFCSDFASRKNSANYTANPVDSHPGTSSSEFFARYIASFLESDYKSMLSQAGPADGRTAVMNFNSSLPAELDTEVTSACAASLEASFTYPAADDSAHFLNYPEDMDYVTLCFEYPTDIADIRISGEELQSVDLSCYSINDKLGYDDRVLKDIGSASGSDCSFADDTDDYVTTLCIHAQTKDGVAAKLNISVTAGERGVSVCGR